MVYFFQFFIQQIKVYYYTMVKNPGMVIALSIVSSIILCILIFVIYHIQDFINPLIQMIDNIFNKKASDPLPDSTTNVNDIKIPEQKNSTNISTTKIIIGVTITVVVITGSVGTGLIILSLVGAKGGWGGA